MVSRQGMQRTLAATPSDRKQQLGADVGVGIATAVQRHRIPGGEQHEQP